MWSRASVFKTQGARVIGTTTFRRKGTHVSRPPTTGPMQRSERPRGHGRLFPVSLLLLQRMSHRWSGPGGILKQRMIQL